MSLDAEFRLRLPSDFASRLAVALGSELVLPPPPKDFHLLATSAFPPVVGCGRRPAAFGHNSLGPAEPGLPAVSGDAIWCHSGGIEL